MISGKLITLYWIIFLLYWKLSAQNVKPTKEMKQSFTKGWLWAGRIFFIALFIISFSGAIPFLSNELFLVSNSFIFASSVTVFIGLVIAIIARNTLSKNWSGNIEIKKNHELITSGVYGIIRNPIYTGIITMCTGTFLAARNLASLLFLIFMTIFCIYKLKEEEKLLQKHFPKTYPSYKKKVKSLIPFMY
ncbi:MAG TPA: isoprenylcysteine carboxylmethyltransferase family protein [Patescibacteria group bacterium]|nr:isoprenylcysteine carboxylmethyltransferase family protein [Patescibacteria group bacterium]